MPTFSSSGEASVALNQDGSQATVTVTNYVRVSPSSAQGSYNGSYNVKMGGAMLGSGTSTQFISGYYPGTGVITRSQTFATVYGSTGTVDWEVNWLSASDDDGYVTRTDAGSITIPQRPPAVPSAPTSATATRNSDTRIDVTWVRPANAGSAGTIWTTARVYRSVNGGAYGLVATGLAGTATSWSDTSVSANATYRYQVRGYNSSGEGASATTGFVDTTPATPTSVTATKDGLDVVMTWLDNSPAETAFEVYRNSTLIATTAANVTSYRDVGAPAGSLSYQVRAKTDGPVLYSGYGTAPTISTSAPPNPPVIVSPNGQALNAALPIVLTFTHNPVDTTAQTAFRVDHRLVGSSTWTTVTGTTATSVTLPVGTYASGANVEWRAQTKGGHATYSNYSPTATFSLSSIPVAGITYPVAGTPHEEPSVTVVGTYYQADSHPQTGWEFQIRQGGVVLQSQSGTGAVLSWTSGPILQGEQSYEARFRVRESSGFWSEWAARTFSVEFDPPLTPTVSVTWVPEGYYEVTGAARSNGVAPDASSMVLERSVNGGEWQVLAEGLTTTFTYFDWTGPLVGHIVYRVTAVTSLPSSSSTEVVIERLPEDTCEILLSGGPGFATVIRLLYDQKRTITGGRHRVLNQWDSRQDPTSTSGMARTLSFAVSATLAQVPCADGSRPATTAADVTELSMFPGIHLYRDHDGWTFPCHLEPTQADPDFMGEVSFTVTRVDQITSQQLLAIAGYTATMVAETHPGEWGAVT